MSHNEITGDKLISKPSNKTYEENWDKIFKKKPSCLDSAYERKAMEEGMCSEPVFKENKVGRCIIHDNEKVEND
jgi:hypothetical protein